MNYIEKIKEDMYAAMKSKDKVKATILRSLLSNLKKIEIEKKEPIAEPEYLSIVKKMVKQLKESIDVYSQAERIELAEKEKSELSIIEAYLPKQFSEEEILELIKKYNIRNFSKEYFRYWKSNGDCYEKRWWESRWRNSK